MQMTKAVWTERIELNGSTAYTIQVPGFWLFVWRSYPPNKWLWETRRVPTPSGQMIDERVGSERTSKEAKAAAEATLAEMERGEKP